MSGTDIGAILSGVAALIPAILACLEFIRRRDTRKKSQEEPSAIQQKGIVPRFRYAWIALVAILLAVTSIALVTVPRVFTPTVEISITYPEDGSAIPIEATIRGYASRELSSEEHLYIVVEHGGRWWPQYSEIIAGYSQASRGYEFDAPVRIGEDDEARKTFVINAILVDSSVHSAFQKWLKFNTTMGE